MKSLSLFFASFVLVAQAHASSLTQIQCEFLNMKLNIERLMTDRLAVTKMDLDQGANHLVFNSESDIAVLRLIDTGSRVTYQLGSQLHVVSINSLHGKNASSLKIGDQGEIRGTCTETKY